MTIYTNNQGDGLFIVFKFGPAGDLNTNSYNGSWARKPPARTYNKIGPTKQQWNRYRKDGYLSRAAQMWFDDEGEVHVEFIDQEWIPTVDRCGHTDHSGPYGRRDECQRRVDHDGIHWSGIEAKRDPDFDPIQAAIDA